MSTQDEAYAVAEQIIEFFSATFPDMPVVVGFGIKGEEDEEEEDDDTSSHYRITYLTFRDDVAFSIMEMMYRDFFVKYSTDRPN